MDNVIEFKPRKVDEPEDPVHTFIMDKLLPWAMEQGIDISSTKFKFNGATIMTCLQGMLLDDI